MRIEPAVIEALERRRLLSLSNLYTFNDGSFSDTAGSSGGTLENGASITGGSLSLTNGATITSGSASAQYGLLPGSLLSTSSLTIEAWFTASNLPSTAHLFDFGTSNQSSQLYFDPHTGSAVFTEGGHTITAAGAAADTGSEELIAVVIDSSAGLLELYENGGLAASVSLGSESLSGFTDTNSYLGRSNLSTDSVFNGTIDEVRIWNQALPAPAISTDAAVGPTVGQITPVNIGTFTSPGTGTYASGVYTIGSSASTIGGSSDAFGFSNVAEFGDTTLVSELTGFSSSTSGGMGGLMLRDGTSASAEFAGVFVDTNGTADFEVRTSVGGNDSVATVTGISIPTGSSPIYLKLTRSGQAFSGYYSTNGSSYTQIGSTQTFAMEVATLGGMAVASSSGGTNLAVTFAKTQLFTEYAPLNFTATYTGSTSVTLDWGQRLGLGSSAVSSYQILYSTNGTSFSSVTSGLSGAMRSYTDSSLSANTTYYFELIATYGDGTTANTFTWVQSTTAPAALESTLETTWTTQQYITAYENYDTASHVSGILGETPSRFTLQEIMFCAGLYTVTTGSTQTAYLNDCISELTSTANKIPSDINFSLAEFCYIYDQVKGALTSSEISSYQTAIDTMGNDVISQDLETGTDFNRGISDMLGLAYAAKLLTGVSAYSSDVSNWTNYYTTQFNNTFERIQDTDEDAVNYNSIWLDDLVMYVQVTGMNQTAFYSNPNVEQIFYRYMQEASSLGVIPKYGEYSFGEMIYAPAMLEVAKIYGDGQFTYVAERAWNYERAQQGASNFVGIDTSSANTDYWPVFMFSTGVPAPVAPTPQVTYEDQRWGMSFPDKLVFNTGNNGTGTDLLDNLSNGMSHGEQDATALDGLIYDNAVLLTSPMTQFSSANTAATQDIDTYEEYQDEVLDEPVGNSYPELPNVENQLGTGQWMHIVLNLNQGTPENAGGVNLADITSMELRIARGDTDNTGDNYDLYLADVQAVGSGGTLTLDNFTNGQAWDGGQIVTSNLPPGQSDALEVPAPTGEFPSFQLSYPVNLSSYSTLQFWIKLTPEVGASGVPLLQFRMDSNYNGDTYSSEWLDWQFDTYHEGPVTQMGSYGQMQFGTINSVLDDTQGGDNNELRSIMVLPGGLVWVRDQVTFNQAESAQIGPVWNVQNILAQGANWFETQQDAQSGQEGETASNLFYANQENLLVYFVPQSGDSIGDGVSPYASSDTPFGLYQKWDGSASSGQSETFNTLLLANSVGTNATSLASTVDILESDNTATVALVGNDYVVINPTGVAINVGGLQTNAQYLTIQMTGSLPTYLSGSEGSYVILNGKTIYSTPQVTANFESYLPTVATTAAANPSPVITQTSTALSVLGSDTNGENNLTYTWSATGPASVGYSGAANGTNAAKAITANFTTVGLYDFTVTITDANGLSTTSTVAVNVQYFAVQSGGTLNIYLSGNGAVNIGTSGSNIAATQNSTQLNFSGITGITVTDLGTGDTLNLNGPVTAPIGFIGAGSPIVNVNSTGIVFAAAPGGTVNLGAISLASGASAMITPATTTEPTTLSVNTLSIATTGRLDVTNNIVLIHYGSGSDPISTIAGYITSGYSGGTWAGDGIYSSVAANNLGTYGLGYADSADANNPAGLPSGTIEIMYTLLGDANLDGKVNGSDFVLMSSSFNDAVTNGWDQGDFNYSGTVNGDDFVLLSDNFNQASNITLGAIVVPATPASNSSVTTPQSEQTVSQGVSNAVMATDVTRIPKKHKHAR